MTYVPKIGAGFRPSVLYCLQPYDRVPPAAKKQKCHRHQQQDGKRTTKRSDYSGARNKAPALSSSIIASNAHCSVASVYDQTWLRFHARPGARRTNGNVSTGRSGRHTAILQSNTFCNSTDCTVFIIQSSNRSITPEI